MTTTGEKARSALLEAAGLNREAAGAQRESEEHQRQFEEAQRQSNSHHREAQSAQSINERSLRAGQGAISTLIAAAETVQAVFADAADTYGRGRLCLWSGGRAFRRRRNLPPGCRQDGAGC